MNGNPKPVPERLYLHKDGKNSIYVDSLLHQHHIDGIRFLYKQFKMKNPGVIINNPLGYDNSMLVALFLRAIQPLLQKPILIICKEDDDFEWVEYFISLLQEQEVIVAAENPFVKKAIFINTMRMLEKFCRRDWGIIVVDDDAFLKEKTLQTKFRTDFKIWITPFDMKDQLQMFAAIFKWFSPKDKLNIDEFKAKPGNIKDAVAKAIALDAFLQDIVFRTHLLAPIETPDTISEGTPKKVSKKNKDATGTKIKRSKRLADSAGTSAGVQENNNKEVGASAVKIPKRETPTDTGDFSIGNFRNNVESTKECDVIDNNCEMDVESFIRNEKPIRYDPSNHYMQDCDNISRNSEESRTDLIREPTIFSKPEKLIDLNHVSDASMDVTDNQESFIDSDTNLDSPMAIPKSFEESTQDFNLIKDDERKQVTPEFVTENIINEIKDKVSEPRLLEVNNDTNPEETLKVEEPAKIVVESPKKDLNSKLLEMDEQISKKFQGSLLDKLF